jgi:hypothetical protein
MTGRRGLEIISPHSYAPDHARRGAYVAPSQVDHWKGYKIRLMVLGIPF